MSVNGFRKGDQVAIVVAFDAPAEMVCELATVNYVGATYIQLNDGRMYDKAGRRLSKFDPTYIFLATDEHREALE